MSNVIIICGDVGTGKTRSVKNLNPKETFLINVLNKPLSFRGNSYEINKNMISTSDWSVVGKTIIEIGQKKPEIKTIIIDDAGFIMTTELFNRSSEKGYEKFTEIGTHMQRILSCAKDQREDLTVIFIFHEDDDTSDRIKVSKKVKTIGMMLEDKYNPLGVVTIALFTNVDFNKDGEAVYSFITNRTLINGVIIPAKSPEGMFDSLKIPNDLDLVIKKIKQYYGK